MEQLLTLGVQQWLKKHQHVITHEYIFWCFFPSIRSLGFVGALFLNLFSTFFERFSCYCWVFFCFFSFVFFCRFMCVILWSAKKGTVNLEETYQRSNFVLWDGQKKPRNCLQNINVFMISWEVEVNQVGTIMAKEGEDINSAVLIRTTKVGSDMIPLTQSHPV